MKTKLRMKIENIALSDDMWKSVNLLVNKLEIDRAVFLGSVFSAGMYYTLNQFSEVIDGKKTMDDLFNDQMNIMGIPEEMREQIKNGDLTDFFEVTV